MKVYCIYDRVAEEAGGLVTCPTDGVAVRMFKASMGKSPYSPNDYQLYCLGEFNPTDMVLFGVKPRLVPLSYAGEMEETVDPVKE